jgi:hypothetical protein
LAEFHIDLGNPGVDLVGLRIHIGELLEPARTNPLDLYKHLKAGPAEDFMYDTLGKFCAMLPEARGARPSDAPRSLSQVVSCFAYADVFGLFAN